MRPRISIRGFVRLSVRPSVGLSIRPSVGWSVGPSHNLLWFLFACHTTTSRFVGWSVRLFVTLYFFWFLRSLASLLLPKWSSDLKYGPCPPARDYGSCVSGLVSFHFRVQIIFNWVSWKYTTSIGRGMATKVDNKIDKGALSIFLLL